MSAVRSFWYFLFTSPEESCCRFCLFSYPSFVSFARRRQRRGVGDGGAEAGAEAPTRRRANGSQKCRSCLSTPSKKMHVCTCLHLYVAINFRLRLLPPSAAWPAPACLGAVFAEQMQSTGREIFADERISVKRLLRLEFRDSSFPRESGAEGYYKEPYWNKHVAWENQLFATRLDCSCKEDFSSMFLPDSPPWQPTFPFQVALSACPIFQQAGRANPVAVSLAYLSLFSVHGSGDHKVCPGRAAGRQGQTEMGRGHESLSSLGF